MKRAKLAAALHDMEATCAELEATALQETLTPTPTLPHPSS